MAQGNFPSNESEQKISYSSVVDIYSNFLPRAKSQRSVVKLDSKQLRKDMKKGEMSSSYRRHVVNWRRRRSEFSHPNEKGILLHYFCFSSLRSHTKSSWVLDAFLAHSTHVSSVSAHKPRQRLQNILSNDCYQVQNSNVLIEPHKSEASDFLCIAKFVSIVRALAKALLYFDNKQNLRLKQNTEIHCHCFNKTRKKHSAATNCENRQLT